MESTDQWSRRRFLGVSADAALLASLASVLRPLTALADAREPTLTVYDPRFPAALALARDLGGGAAPRPAATDPTDLVLALADAPGARLQGVTPESVPFCLAQLLPGARLTQHRADRDLFVWTLETRS
jgi:hypothetical protein